MITDIRGPFKWMNAENTAFECEVQVFGEYWHPFHCMESDSTSHSQEIWKSVVVDAEHGEMEAFVEE